jgi:hypothetical protein
MGYAINGCVNPISGSPAGPVPARKWYDVPSTAIGYNNAAVWPALKKTTK